jgi:hypothetical protein
VGAGKAMCGDASEERGEEGVPEWGAKAEGAAHEIDGGGAGAERRRGAARSRGRGAGRAGRRRPGRGVAATEGIRNGMLGFVSCLYMWDRARGV